VLSFRRVRELPRLLLRGAAQRHSASLADRGYDVYVGGVAAYSTLGWFSDPVLSSFIHYPESEVARIVFHELAHQVVYVKGDTMFNESFATTVEEEGVHRWLEREGTPAQRAAYEDSRRRRSEFVALVMKYRRNSRILRSAGRTEESAWESGAVLGDAGRYLALKGSWAALRLRPAVRAQGRTMRCSRRSRVTRTRACISRPARAKHGDLRFFMPRCASWPSWTNRNAMRVWRSRAAS